MIITLKTGKKIDTETDLSAAERHIVQKLIIWKTIVDSNHAFDEKIHAALSAGWNNSGPVKASPTLLTILSKFTKEVELRVEDA